MNDTAGYPASPPPGSVPGRSCPLHYRYAPEVFGGAVPTAMADLDVLYVVGGLYGNALALEVVLRLFEAEGGRKRLVFNGDFHWFDAQPALFAEVQQAVLAHHALRGNVETELAEEDPGADAGCGCAYPDWVEDAVVTRSNRILAQLRTVTTPAQRQALAALPMWMTASVGGLKLALVHGDAQSLAGWGFAQEHLAQTEHRAIAREWFARAGVDAFACTHTCLPVFRNLAPRDAQRPAWVFNNGAAGMPNFQGDPAGLLTRVALSPYAGPARRLGIIEGAVHVDAIAIEVEPEAMRARFLALWPAGSDAHASYFNRIMQGPAYHPDQVIQRTSWEP